MKILEVGNHAYPCVGGIESVIQDTASAMMERGHQVQIFTYNTCHASKSTLPPQEVWKNIPITRVSPRGLRFYPIPPIRPLVQKAREVDVVHVHGFGPWLDVLVLTKPWHGKPIILTTHGGFYHTPARGLLKKIYHRVFLPLILRGVEKVLFVGPADEEKFASLAGKKGQRFPNGIRLQTPARSGTQKQMHSVFVGRLSKNKHVEKLLDAFVFVHAQNPRARLHIAGEDWEGLQPSLEAHAQKLGLEKAVVFHGKCSHAQLARLYKECGIFVSASAYEGFGISTIEAMAAGCVPVLNDIPSFREFAEGERGILTHFEHAEEAGNAWSALLTLPKTKLALKRKKCVEYVKQFDQNALMDRLEKIYQHAGGV